MKTIIWNVDDVLNNLTETWLQNCWLPSHPDCALEYSDLVEAPPYRLLGVPPLEFFVSLQGYCPSADEEMQPRWLILEWLNRHGAEHRHVAISSRPVSTAASASAWVFRHYGEYIRNFAVVPRQGVDSLPVYDRDKLSYLKWFGHFTALVDDNLDVIGAVRRAGLRGLLFPQPWNQERQSQEQALAKLTLLLEDRPHTQPQPQPQPKSKRQETSWAD